LPAPKKITPEVVERIVGILSTGADYAKAAHIVGVSRKSIWAYGKRNPEIRERFDEARALADEQVVQSLFDAAIGGNVVAMIFWLKNRRQKEWRDRHEVGGAGDGPITLRIERVASDIVEPTPETEPDEE